MFLKKQGTSAVNTLSKYFLKLTFFRCLVEKLCFIKVSVFIVDFLLQIPIRIC